MSNGMVNCPKEGLLTISGEFGFATASNLDGQIQKLMGSDKKYTIDLSAVTASDSAGLAMMLEWMDRQKKIGQELNFCNVPESLLEIARVSNLIDLLPLVDA